MAKVNTNDLVIGDWHGGLDSPTRGDVEALELKLRQGSGVFGLERLAAELIHLLNAYDDLAGELLVGTDAPAPVVGVDGGITNADVVDGVDAADEEDEKWEDFLLEQEDFHEYEVQAAEEIPEIDEFIRPLPIIEPIGQDEPVYTFPDWEPDPQPPEPIKPPRVGKAKSRPKGI